MTQTWFLTSGVVNQDQAYTVYETQSGPVGIRNISYVAFIVWKTWPGSDSSYSSSDVVC